MPNSRHISKRLRRSSSRRLGVLVVAMGMLAVACGASGEIDTALDPIETNGGGVLVTPPDVLAGDPAPTTAPVTEATSAPIPTAPPVTPLDAGDIPAPVEGAPATPIVEFEYFDGSAASTADFAGVPTVVNFWASNCPACIAEMPEFEEVHQARLGEIDFIGMNTADVSREAAVRLAEQTGVTYRLADDTDSAVFREFGGFAMPTTVFLNAQGQVAFSWVGVLNGEELERLIEEHLAPGSDSDV